MGNAAASSSFCGRDATGGDDHAKKCPWEGAEEPWRRAAGGGDTSGAAGAATASGAAAASTTGSAAGKVAPSAAAAGDAAANPYIGVVADPDTHVEHLHTVKEEGEQEKGEVPALALISEGSATSGARHVRLT